MERHLLLLGFILILSGVISYSPDETQLQAGQQQYQNALRESQMPRYGSCWRDALNLLQNGCKHLTDDVQRRLALHFANCFLEKAGQKTYPCADNADLKVCLRDIDSNGFTSFNNFFTHTQSMCYFLQNQVWQEKTENTVAKLSESSAAVVQTLEDTNELQDKILGAQKKSLAQQERLLESSALLGQALDTSKDSVKHMLEEFRSSTSEQRNLIFEVFDRLSKLQNLVLGEVSGFYSLIFYPTALLTVYLLTSTSRTAAARFWLFVLFSCSLALERFIVSITISDDSSGYLPADEASKEMYWRIWAIRKIAMMSCTAILAYYAYKFEDYNKINNELLKGIQQQNLELKSTLESYGIRVFSSIKLTSSDVTDALDKKKIEEQSNFSSDDDSDFSYDSDASDATFVPSEDDTFETASSRLSMVSTSFLASPEPLNPTLTTSGALVKTEFKPDRSASRSSRCNTPQPLLTPRPSQSQSPYNLRSRSNSRLLKDSTVSNESPEAFGRVLKQVERVSRQNSKMVVESIKEIKASKKNNYYSSDED